MQIYVMSSRQSHPRPAQPIDFCLSIMYHGIIVCSISVLSSGVPAYVLLQLIAYIMQNLLLSCFCECDKSIFRLDGDMLKYTFFFCLFYKICCSKAQA